MGKTSKTAAARRAKKKHEKEQKRKSELARRQRAAEPPRRENPWIPVQHGIAGLAALERMHFYEAAYMAEPIACHTCGGGELPAGVWSCERIADLSEREILARLDRLGVRVTRDEEIAGGAGSAVAYARAAWLPRLPSSAGVHERDFVCLAACALRALWRPDPPSQEMLIEARMDGERSALFGDEADAVERWMGFWALLRPLLTPAMRTTRDADALLGEYSDSLLNWTVDFSTAATEAARCDPALGRRALGVQGEIVDQFSGEDNVSWRTPMMSDRAEILYVTGEREKAEGILQAQIAARPDHGRAYVTLAELWARHGLKDREGQSRALALLEQALAVPVRNPRNWDLKERVRSLRMALAVADDVLAAR